MTGLFVLEKFQLRRKKMVIWKTGKGMVAKIKDTFQRNCGTQNKSQVSLSWWIKYCQTASQHRHFGQRVKQLHYKISQYFVKDLCLAWTSSEHLGFSRVCSFKSIEKTWKFFAVELSFSPEFVFFKCFVLPNIFWGQRWEYWIPIQ